jgi:hypothetical protein
MARTTVDIDSPLLAELKRLQKREAKSLGRLISELLAEAVAHRKSEQLERPAFAWIARPMGARVDLTDKDAVFAALERSGEGDADGS